MIKRAGGDEGRNKEVRAKDDWHEKGGQQPSLIETADDMKRHLFKVEEPIKKYEALAGKQLDEYL